MIFLNGKKVLTAIVKVLLCVVAIFLAYWFILPPINLRSTLFWIFLILCAVIVFAIHFISSFAAFISALSPDRIRISPERQKESWKKMSGAKAVFGVLIGAASIIALMFVATFFGSTLFNAGRYRDLISIQEGDFTQDVAEISMSQIPVVDRDTASRLGKRKLGEMSDLVSQFEIDEFYTQINYRGTPVRVTPLKYADPIKWLYNNQKGLPAYIKVDMVTQETTLIRLDEGIKYSPGEYFMRRLDRHLRFKYPTKIFDEVSFEIDDEGTPYWVAPTISYKIALWSGRDIGGAVLVNAVTGECQYYDIKDIPSWVDQVYVSNLVVEQLNYNGKYVDGFWNSIFGQRGVLQTTDGYNYIAIGDDVYLYTGMTSVVSDESNVGFVLVNLRTKETKYYSIPGAEEYSAMGSAQGQVQHLNYTSTFPLLLNISDRPTYFMSLKDAAGLVKMYAFVDVEQYQVVGTGATVDAAREDYISKLRSENTTITETQTNTVSGILSAVNSAVIDGNTCYYLMLEGDQHIYTAAITVSNHLPFLKAADSVKISYSEIGGVRVVSKIEL